MAINLVYAITGLEWKPGIGVDRVLEMTR